MSWRDDLTLQGSFRGVPFRYDSADSAGGRRVAEFEYPGRDLAEVEDLGLGLRRFGLVAYLLGADYHLQLVRLIAALEQPGPGQLLHPTRGPRTVQVKTYQAHESSREGGHARITIDFVEAVTLPPPAADSAAGVTDAAEAARAQVDAALQLALPAPVLANDATALVATKAVDAVTGGLLDGTLGALVRLPDQIIGRLEGVDDAVSQRLAGVNGLRLSFQRLLDLPEAAANILALTQLRLGVLTDLQRWFRLGSGPRTAAPGSVARTVADHAVVTVATIAATQIAEVSWPSRDEAQQYTRGVITMLQRAQLTAGDEVFTGLRALIEELVNDLAVRGEQQERLTSVVLPEIQPSLVLAHRLYGPDALQVQEADLIRRNLAAARDPGFLPAGVPLEVISA